MLTRPSSLFGRIISVFILVIAAVTIPITIFIYSYGDALTTDNLMDQLEVSMSDNRIRFSQSIQDISSVITALASSADVQHLLEEGGEDAEGQLRPILEMANLGYEDNMVATIVSLDGSLSASTGGEAASIYTPSLLDSYRSEDIIYDTDIRYREGEYVVVMNIIRQITSSDGRLLGWAVGDVFGDPFVHFADPALVNAACIYNPATGMVSSLTYLDIYSPYSELTPFAGLPLPEGESFSAQRDGRLFSFYYMPELSLYIAGYLDVTPYLNSLNRFYTLLFAVISAVVIFSVAIAVYLARSLVRPIKKLSSAMMSVEDGNMEVRVVTSNISEMADLESKFNEMLSQINELIEKNREESEKVAEAERKALEAQMNPHFLFNTLNVIRSIARMHHESEIEQITIKLGRLLRYAVDNHESTETLENSFMMVESYLDIQRVRFGEKLHAELYIEPGLLSVRTPKLIIQPLVENAIGHGLEKKIGEWHLSVRIVSEGDMVHITVRDNGVGFDSSATENMEDLATSGHTGMYNVYKRLKLCYGEKAGFTVSSQLGEGTEVELVFPIKGAEEK